MKKCYGGIDLGGTFIKAGLLTQDGRQITKFKIPTGVPSGIPAVRDNLRKAAQRLMDSAKKRNLRLAAIGVGSPGTIRYPEGIVTASSPNIPGWVGTNISAIFSDFPFAVACDNDANCMALAEATFGAGKGTSLGFYFTLGTGVGGAIVVNGSLLRGASFAAGEFGHTVFVYNGKKCKTGRRGCLEGYVATPALIALARRIARKYEASALKKKNDTLTTEDIFEAFEKGDEAAVEAVGKNAEMIGVAVGSIVNLLNPEIVVIGGGMSHGGRRYIQLIRKTVMAYAFDSATSVLKITTARFGNEAGWIGAACLHLAK